jgi:hypothetical protein
MGSVHIIQLTGMYALAFESIPSSLLPKHPSAAMPVQDALAQA